MTEELEERIARLERLMEPVYMVLKNVMNLMDEWKKEDDGRNIL